MKKLPAWLFFTMVALVLSAPLIVIAGVSLNERKRLLFPPEPVSLHWYGEVFANQSWLQSIFYSLGIAFASALVAVTIALPLSYAAWRRGLRLAKFLRTLGLTPFLLPPVIVALGFLIFFSSLGHIGRLENVIIGHSIFFLALPLVTLSLGFDSVDPELVEAAQTMGASDSAIFRTVLLPMILPYLFCGYAFVFVLSLNEYIVAYMIAGFAIETLPIKIFNALRYGYTPIMAVVAVLFTVTSMLVFTLIAWFGDLPKLLGAIDPREN